MIYAAEFVWAVAYHWVALMSGLASVVIAIWLQVKNRPGLNANVFWGIGGICLFLAFYLAWRDEHSDVVDLKAKLVEAGGYHPKLKLFVYQAGIGPWPRKKDTAILFADVGVRNSGSPSALRDWKVVLKIDSNHQIVGAITRFVNPIGIRGDHSSNTRLSYPEEFLVERTLVPIQTGAETTGTIFAGFTGVSEDQARTKGSVVIVSCKDIVDNTYEGEKPLIASGDWDPRSVITPGLPPRSK